MRGMRRARRLFETTNLQEFDFPIPVAATGVRLLLIGDTDGVLQVEADEGFRWLGDLFVVGESGSGCAYVAPRAIPPINAPLPPPPMPPMGAPKPATTPMNPGEHLPFSARSSELLAKG